MNPTIKRLILFTVGAVSITKEKIDDFVQQLEKEGALNKEEGEQIVKDFLKESEKRTNEFREAVEKEVRRVLAEVNKPDAKPAESKHTCADCGKECDCTDMENCQCDENCNCEDCSKPAQK